MGSVRVTLHRVGRDSAGPVDSVRTTPSGAYSFTYRAWGADDAVYFVSASYSGIAYFGVPLRGSAVTGPDAEITVFDTTSAPIPLTVRGRHVIVSAPGGSGSRTVTEVYDVSNDSSLTAIAPADGATFTALLPDAAANPRAAGGDVSEEAISFSRGRAVVAAPFAPGLKQIMLSYTLPPTAFPLSVPVVRGAEVLEVLVEDPTAQVSGAGLRPTNDAAVSGHTFKRFLAQDVPPNAVVRVSVPAPPAVSRTRYLQLVGLVIGAAMLGALVRALLLRRRAPAAAAAASPEAEPERIAREIAALDARFEQESAPDTEARAAYAEQRAQLKARLTAALAGRGD